MAFKFESTKSKAEEQERHEPSVEGVSEGNFNLAELISAKVEKLRSIGEQVVSRVAGRIAEANQSIGLSPERFQGLKTKLGVEAKLAVIAEKIADVCKQAEERLRAYAEVDPVSVDTEQVVSDAEIQSEAIATDVAAIEKVEISEEKKPALDAQAEQVAKKETVTFEKTYWCEKCGNMVVHANFCSRCGEPEANPEELRQCEQCGTLTKGGVAICPKCGQEHEDVSREVDAAQESAVTVEIPLGADSDLNPEAMKTEVFDPEAELKNIRKGTKAEQHEKLATYKEQLILQKRFIANMNRCIVRSFEQNPQLNTEEFYGSLQQFMDQAKLAGWQREVMKGVIDKFSEQNKKVSAFLDQYRGGEGGEIDPVRVYEGLFGKKPVGRVEVIPTGVSIQIRTEDLRDYAFVTSRSYVNAPAVALTEQQLAEANQSAGLKTGSRLQPDLGGSIILENCSQPGRFESKDENSEETRRHEQQHVYNGIIQNVYDADRIKAGKRNDALVSMINKKFEEVKNKQDRTDEDVDQVINESKRVRAERERIVDNAGLEAGIKDEISAYFTENENPSADVIRLTLLGQKTIYDNYNERYKAREGSDAKRGKFSQEYMGKVDSGIVAFDRMLKAGYSKEDVQAMLFTEPLSSWGRMADRFLGTMEGKNERKKELQSNVESYELKKGVQEIQGVESVGDFIGVVRDLPPIPSQRSGEFIDPGAIVQIVKDLSEMTKKSDNPEDLIVVYEKIKDENIIPIDNVAIKAKLQNLLMSEWMQSGQRVEEKEKKKKEVVEKIANAKSIGDFITAVMDLPEIPNAAVKGATVNKEAVLYFVTEYQKKVQSEDPKILKGVLNDIDQGNVLAFAQAHGIQKKFEELLRSRVMRSMSRIEASPIIQEPVGLKETVPSEDSAEVEQPIATAESIALVDQTVERESGGAAWVQGLEYPGDKEFDLNLFSVGDGSYSEEAYQKDKVAVEAKGLQEYDRQKWITSQIFAEVKRRIASSTDMQAVEDWKNAALAEADKKFEERLQHFKDLEVALDVAYQERAKAEVESQVATEAKSEEAEEKPDGGEVESIPALAEFPESFEEKPMLCENPGNGIYTSEMMDQDGAYGNKQYEYLKSKYSWDMEQVKNAYASIATTAEGFKLRNEAMQKIDKEFQAKSEALQEKMLQVMRATTESMKRRGEIAGSPELFVPAIGNAQSLEQLYGTITIFQALHIPSINQQIPSGMLVNQMQEIMNAVRNPDSPTHQAYVQDLKDGKLFNFLADYGIKQKFQELALQQIG